MGNAILTEIRLVTTKLMQWLNDGLSDSSGGAKGKYYAGCKTLTLKTFFQDYFARAQNTHNITINTTRNIS